MGAVGELPADLRRRGWKRAWWLLKFRTSASWLDHLTSDHYPSCQGFEQRYGAIFPGARFHALGYAHALVWRNPALATRRVRQHALRACFRPSTD